MGQVVYEGEALHQAHGTGYPLEIIEKLGELPRLVCVCGAFLVLDYADHSMTERLHTFADTHESCEA